MKTNEVHDDRFIERVHAETHHTNKDNNNNNRYTWSSELLPGYRDKAPETIRDLTGVGVKLRTRNKKFESQAIRNPLDDHDIKRGVFAKYATNRNLQTSPARRVIDLSKSKSNLDMEGVSSGGLSRSVRHLRLSWHPSKFHTFADISPNKGTRFPVKCFER